jgi:hypothetical protein
MAMESPDEKAALINELELKLTALVQERDDIHRKCDSEPDPKQRAIYWIKIGTLEATIHQLRNDIFSRKVS